MIFFGRQCDALTRSLGITRTLADNEKFYIHSIKKCGRTDFAFTLSFPAEQPPRALPVADRRQQEERPEFVLYLGASSLNSFFRSCLRVTVNQLFFRSANPHPRRSLGFTPLRPVCGGRLDRHIDRDRRRVLGVWHRPSTATVMSTCSQPREPTTRSRGTSIL